MEENKYKKCESCNEMHTLFDDESSFMYCRRFDTNCADNLVLKCDELTNQIRVSERFRNYFVKT